MRTDSEIGSSEVSDRANVIDQFMWKIQAGFDLPSQLNLNSKFSQPVESGIMLPRMSDPPERGVTPPKTSATCRPPCVDGAAFGASVAITGWHIVFFNL
jgi:hypothetical protein